MEFAQQKILPAVRDLKQLDRFLASPYEYGVLLDSHVGQLRAIVNAVHKAGKKIFLHVDLIQGLKHDEYAAEFLCQDIKPDGLISTRSTVITKAKQRGVIAIQRLFLIDSSALTKTYSLIEKARPDYIEVLPGIVPSLIAEVHEATGVPIIAGGFIRSTTDVETALNAGAIAVTTSERDLWKAFSPQ